MAEYTKTIKISQELSDKIKDLLELTGEECYDKYGLKRDETIVETVTFDNGNIVDIKCCIADYNDYTWTEGILFDEYGNEITYTEPSDQFLGEWQFEDEENNKYTVLVEVE